MFPNLLSTFGPLEDLSGWEEEEARSRALRMGNLYKIGFVTAWEIQSQLATVTLIALVAFLPLWFAVVPMLLWSLVATGLYYASRRRGLPDLFEAGRRPKAGRASWPAMLFSTLLSAVKAWLAGVQPFIYSRTFCRVLVHPGRSIATRTARMAVLGVGLTLFGVTAAHHMLRKAGLPEDKVLRLSFVGPFLNVPYRLLLSAALINAVQAMIRPLAI